MAIDLEKMMAELIKSQAKTDAQMAKTDAQMAKTDIQMAKTNIQMNEKIDRLFTSQAKTDEQLAETDKQVKALTRDIFGISNSIGLEAEEFFYNAIKDRMQLGNIKFDYASKNNKTTIKADKQEIDIMLENGNYIGIIEVKNKVSKNTIKQLDKIMDKFYYFHPFFKDYKLVGGIAGKIFPNDLQTLALKKGYSVLTQKGDYMEQINP